MIRIGSNISKYFSYSEKKQEKKTYSNIYENTQMIKCFKNLKLNLNLFIDKMIFFSIRFT